MTKAAMLFVLQRVSLTISKTEHQIKLGEKTYQEINLLNELSIINNITKHSQISKVHGTFFSGLIELIEDLDLLMKARQAEKYCPTKAITVKMKV